MALINHSGRLTQKADISILQSYGCENKTRALAVELWAFENLPYGMIAVRWANGAHGSGVTSDVRELHAWARAITGWPEPLLHSRTLPYSSGCVHMDELRPPVQEKIHDESETDSGDAHIAVRRTRTRTRAAPMP